MRIHTHMPRKSMKLDRDQSTISSEARRAWRWCFHSSRIPSFPLILEYNVTTGAFRVVIVERRSWIVLFDDSFCSSEADLPERKTLERKFHILNGLLFSLSLLKLRIRLPETRYENSTSGNQRKGSNLQLGSRFLISAWARFWGFFSTHNKYHYPEAHIRYLELQASNSQKPLIWMWLCGCSSCACLGWDMGPPWFGSNMGTDAQSLGYRIWKTIGVRI